ncbi:GNAT family N-acetyltransferase [Geothermobacter hydrogeniphilus]|uniref:N-acetyltransferase domain-containing protein n=1 Tax=Geothermobacter hydrogeniphilus TaxID=1969733 RepID=A0A1X0YCR2_9BACT|nr:GNAT family N-acetyltransferase [Geothermobacter hydrogeniphilus]ORJ62958.1 hypothetical protein B5V00_02595 [Geothermobacter hydrogeniphilus]
MNFRNAEQHDWPTILAIYNQAVEESFCTADTEPATLDSRRGWLEQHSAGRYPILLAEENGTILGWCSLSPYRPGRRALAGVAEVSYYLDRQARGRGLAGQLLKQAIHTARQQNFHTLIAILMDVNRPSRRLLEKFHFERWGHLPDVACFPEGCCGQYLYGLKI